MEKSFGQLFGRNLEVREEWVLLQSRGPIITDTVLDCELVLNAARWGFFNNKRIIWLADGFPFWLISLPDTPIIESYMKVEMNQGQLDENQCPPSDLTERRGASYKYERPNGCQMSGWTISYGGD